MHQAKTPIERIRTWGCRLDHGDALDRGGNVGCCWNLARPWRGRHRAARIAAHAFGCAPARPRSVGSLRAVRTAEPLGAHPRAALLSSRSDPRLAGAHCGAGRDHGGAAGWHECCRSRGCCSRDGVLSGLPVWMERRRGLAGGRFVSSRAHRWWARCRSPCGPTCSPPGSKQPVSGWCSGAGSERPAAIAVAGGFAAFGLAISAKQHFLGGPAGRNVAFAPGLPGAGRASVAAGRAGGAHGRRRRGGRLRRRGAGDGGADVASDLRRRDGDVDGASHGLGGAGRSCWGTSAVEARV